MSFAYLAAAILLEICGTTSLKLSDGFSRPAPSVLVVLCYGASFFLFSRALKGIDLSIAYAAWSGIGTAAVAGVGIWIFGEAAGTAKLMSLALIILGVVGLNLAESGR